MKPSRAVLLFFVLFALLSCPGFGQSLSINTPNDISLQLGRAEIALTASGGSGGGYVWSLDGGLLPPGLTIRTDVPSYFPAGTTAGIIGVASEVGDYAGTVKVTDGLGATATLSISFHVLAVNDNNPYELPDGSIGVSYNYTLGVVGNTGAVTRAVTSGAFPPGLALDGATGSITGSPTTAGVYSFGVTFTQGTFSFGRGFQITISPMYFSTPAELPVATDRASYSKQITVTGGVAPHSFAISWGGLPDGLGLSSAGLLSGTPNGQQFNTLGITVTDSTGATARKSFVLTTVGSPNMLPGINYPSYLEDAIIGQYYLASIGGYPGKPPSAWSLASGSSLPPGFAILDLPQTWVNAQHGMFTLAGTGTQAGTYSFTIQWTDSSTPPAVTSRTYVLRVSPLSSDGLPDATFGTFYSQQIRILGGQPSYSFLLVARTLPDGLTMNSSGLVSGTPLETNWFNPLIQITDAGGNTFLRSVWIHVVAGANEINIGQSSPLSNGFAGQSYNLTFTACCAASHVWTIQSGSLPPGLALLTGSSLPAGSPPGSAVLSGTPTANGHYSFTLRATDSANGSNFGQRLFKLQVTPITYSGLGLLPYGNVSSSFSQTLSVSGASGAVTWKVHPDDMLPPGLFLSADGILSGTPSSSGRFWFRIIAADAAGFSTEFWLSVDIYPPGAYPPLYITSGDPTFNLGSVEWQLDATGGTGSGQTWTVMGGALPPGIAIRQDGPSWFAPGASGLIGIPTTPGTYHPTLKVTDSGGNSATRAFTITILPIVLVSRWELPDATRTVAYNQTILAAGGSGALSFTLQSGSSLPPDLNLGAGGQITGTPTTAGTYEFDVSITDGSSTVEQHLRIYVSGLNISTAAELPNAVQGTPYSQTIQVSGGVLPYSFSMGCCAPGWLSLNSATGVLSGTPNGSQYTSLDILVSDSAGAWAHKVFRLGVIGSPLTLPGITTTELEDFNIGWQRWFVIGINGGTPPYNWSITSGSLPPGVAINSPTLAPPPWSWGGFLGGLLIGGTPTVAGNYSFTLKATDSSSSPQSTSRSFTLRVSPIGFQGIPNPTFGAAYSQQVRIFGGALPYLVSVIQGDVPAGLTVGSTGLITGTPKETGDFWFQLKITGAAGEDIGGLGFNVAGTSPTRVDVNQGRSLGDISTNASWSYQLNAGGGTAPYTWTLESGSTMPSGLSLSSGGLISGTPTVAGIASFLVRATDAAGNFGVRMLRLNITPVTVTTGGGLTYANVSSAYTKLMTASGGTGTITWSLAPHNVLPAGMTLNSSGTLSGTPTVSGQYWFSLTATDSASAARTQGFSLSIYPAGEYPPLYVTTSQNQSLQLGRTQIALDADGGSGGYTWSVLSGALPPGLMIRTDVPSGWSSATTAGIIGVATTAGTYSATIKVTDSVGKTATLAMVFNVYALASASNWELPDGSIGVSYDYTLGVVGNTGPVTQAVTSGALPPGLSLEAATGRITGKPTSAGTYNFGVTYTQGSFSIGRGFQIYVSPMQFTTPAALPAGSAYTGYSQTIGVTGGLPPYTFSVPCCLPWNFTLSSDGVLSGMPTGEYYGYHVITVTDSTGATVRRNFLLPVTTVPSSMPTISTTNLTGGEDYFLGENRWFVVNGFPGKLPGAWSLAPGSSLPPGFGALEPPQYFWNAQTGQLNVGGVALQVGSFAFTVLLTDGSTPAMTATRTYTLRVSPLNLDNLPDASFGTAYSKQIRVLGGQPPYTFTLLERNFQNGLSMNSSGLVSGTPWETGNFNPLVLITDAAGNTLQRSVWLNVRAGATYISINYGSPLGNGYTNQTYTRNFVASGGSASYNWTFESGALPPGLALLSGGTLPAGYSAGSALLNGTPILAGIYTFALRATDSSNNANFVQRQYRLQINPFTLSSPTTLPWTNTGASFSQPLTVSGATGSVTWKVRYDSVLPTGLSLSPDGILSGAPTVSGRFSFRLVATDLLGMTNEYTFTVDIYPSGAYPPLYFTTGPDFGRFTLGSIKIQLNATGGMPPYTFSLAPGAPTIPGFRVQNGAPLPSDWSSSIPAGLLGVATAPGTFGTTIRVADSVGHFTDQTVTFTVTELLPTLYSVQQAAVNEPYLLQLTAARGTPGYTFALTSQASSLPPGLNFHSNGKIDGTPTVAGWYSFSVRITDAASNYVDAGYGISVSQFRFLGSRNLLNGQLNVAYSQTMSVEGGKPPYIWSLVTGPLPDGLTLGPDGTISGMPLSTGSWGFNVQVVDSLGATYACWIYIAVLSNSATAPSMGGGDLGQVAVGDYFSYGLGPSGGIPPYTFSVDPNTPLPPGLRLVRTEVLGPGYRAQNVRVDGRVAFAGNYSFNLVITDSVGNSATRACSLRTIPITVDRVSLPDAAHGSAYSYQLLALGGTAPYAWTVDTLPDGLTLSATGLLSGTPFDTGDYYPVIQVADANNAWVTPSYPHILVQSGTPATLYVNRGPNLGTLNTGRYSWSLTSSQSPSASPQYSYALEPGSSMPPGLVLLTGSTLPYSTVSPLPAGYLAGLLTTPGQYKFYLRVSDELGNLGYRTIYFTVTPVTILASSIPNGSIQESYSKQLVAQGGTAPYSWSLNSGYTLPPGLNLSAGGLISGTPTLPGNYTFYVTARDSVGNWHSRGYTITISPLNITNAEFLPLGIVGQPYSVTFNGVGPGTPYVWSANTLPSGFTLNSSTGVLSGTPTGSYSSVITVTVGDGGNPATTFFSKRFALNIRYAYNTPLVSISTSQTYADQVAGTLYQSALSASGGLPPYTWSLVGGALPAGLSLLPGSVFSGSYTPGSTSLGGVLTTPGLYSWTLKVTDTAGTSSQRTFTMWVSTITLATSSPRTPMWGQPFSQVLVGVGGKAPYTFSMPNSTLPPGLSLDSAGVLSGVPTDSGSNSYGIKITDAAGQTFTGNVSLSIDAPGTTFIDWGSSYGLQREAPVGVYKIIPFTALNGTPPYTASIEPGSTLPPGMSLLTGSTLPLGYSSNYALVAGVPTTAGNYVITVRMTDAFGNFVVATAIQPVTPLNVLRPALYTAPVVLTGKVGSPFSYASSMVNGTAPYTFSVVPGNFLPDGLVLSSDGKLTGTPTVAGSFSFSYFVQDANQFTMTGSASVTVYPAAAAIPLTASTGYTLPQASVNCQFTFDLNSVITRGNAPYGWSLGLASALPVGISLAGNQLTGKPVASGTNTFVLTVTDATGQTWDMTFYLTVSKINVSPGALVQAVAGAPYLPKQLKAAGGVAPYTYALVSSDMPVGMTFSADGKLSGSPSTVGMFYIRVEIDDAAGNVLVKNYSFKVNAPGTPLPALDVNPSGVLLSYVQGAPAPAPVPVTVTSTGASLTYAAATSGGAWLSVGGADVNTPGTVNIVFNPLVLAAGNYNGVVTVSSDVAVNSPLTIPVTLTVSEAPPCTYSLSAAGATVAAGGGSGSFGVTSSAYCNWSAKSNVTWIVLTSAGSGTGSGTVLYTVSPNIDTATRTGTVTVQGQVFTVKQFGTSYSYALNPAGTSMGAAGGKGDIMLIASASTAPWSAASADTWISFDTPTSGMGSATIGITVAAYGGTASRAGTVTVADQTFTVAQAGKDCSYNLGTSEASLAWTGGDASLTITAGAGCGWAVANVPSWITVTTGLSGVGTGSAQTIQLTVAANSSTQGRGTTIQVGGQNFDVAQTGVPCSFTVSSSGTILAAAGGSGSVAIAAAGSGCEWVASSNADWITITSALSGKGSATLTYTVSENKEAASRSGTLTIAGQNLTVTQSGVVCSYALRSPSAVVESAGGTNSVGVMAASGCNWTAVSKASWITITSGATGSGTANVTFRVDANAGSAERSGVLRIADQDFGVTQKGVVCVYTLGTAPADFGELGGNGIFSYSSTGAGCVPVVQSYANWITVTSSEFAGGLGTVGYSVPQNITGNARTGTVMVGDVAYTVTQAASSCSYGLTAPTSWKFDRFGGLGEVNFTSSSAAGVSCVPIVTHSPEIWLDPLITLSLGVYKQPYGVPIYQTFIRWVRTLQIVVNGNVYTVKQTSY